MTDKANKLFLLIAIIFCSVFILGFTFLYREDTRKIKTISTDDYIQEFPENFDYNLSVSENDVAFTITGYAIVLNEVPKYVDNNVVLYNKDNNIYIKIPTSLDMTLDVQLPEGEGGYAFGKFSAVILKEDLELLHEEYNLGFLYLSNGHENLVLTNEKLK